MALNTLYLVCFSLLHTKGSTYFEQQLNLIERQSENACRLSADNLLNCVQHSILYPVFIYKSRKVKKTFSLYLALYAKMLPCVRLDVLRKTLNILSTRTVDLYISKVYPSPYLQSAATSSVCYKVCQVVAQ